MSRSRPPRARHEAALNEIRANPEQYNRLSGNPPGIPHGVGYQIHHLCEKFPDFTLEQILRLRLHPGGDPAQDAAEFGARLSAIRSGAYPPPPAPPPPATNRLRAPARPEWDESDLRCGLVCGGIFTNENFSLEMPERIVVTSSASAEAHGKWLLRGAARDGFWLSLDTKFGLGTNEYRRVFVSSSGTLSFDREKTAPLGAAMPDGEPFARIAVFQTTL